MVNKYYCDFCDRSFNDNISTRTKHNNSSLHIVAKKEHYDSFKDVKQIYQEENQKLPCKLFLRNGSCCFSQCKFSHLSAEALNEMKLQLEEAENKEKYLDPTSGAIILTQFLQRLELRKLEARRKVEEASNIKVISHEMPEELRKLDNIPVSLLPFSILQTVEANVPAWGD